MNIEFTFLYKFVSFEYQVFQQQNAEATREANLKAPQATRGGKLSAKLMHRCGF